MKKTVLLLAALLLLTGCTRKGQIMDGPDMVNSYRQIDQETARQMMEQEDGYVIVDVRRTDEYESGHIPGAICIPNESIGSVPPEELPNLRQTILVYCRSGNRSKQAAEKLFEMGYSNIYEFGGILDWTGEVAMGQTLLLTVEANPTTGYSWEAAQDQDLFDVRTFYVSETREEPVSGSGGWQSFILTPKQSGTVQLCLTYSRSWEPSDVDPKIRCTVSISDDLHITVIDDGRSDGQNCGFVPKLTVY